jgi:hypothetical protein
MSVAAAGTPSNDGISFVRAEEDEKNVIETDPYIEESPKENASHTNEESEICEEEVEMAGEMSEESDEDDEKLDHCHECMSTKKNDLKPSPYIHLGWAKSIEHLREKFEVATGYSESSGELKLRKIFFKRNPKKTRCNIHSVSLKLSAKLTVFFKDNPVECDKHKVIVVAMVEKEVVIGKELDWLKKKLWVELIPRVKFTCDGHDGVSEASKIKARQELKKKTVNLELEDDEKKTMKKQLELEHHCKCNGPENEQTGGFATWGCTLRKVGASACKFNTPTLKGRNKFHLKKLSENDSVVEEIATKVCDVLSEKVLCLAPLAARLMLNEASEATLCRLGTANKMFAAMSLNSNFRIHSHVDKNDFPNGITALLNVHKNNGEVGQKHVLVDYALNESRRPGISFDIGDGSLLLEAASREWHASTLPVNPSLQNPSRIALVFFSHRDLNMADHGSETYKKRKKKCKVRRCGV